MPLRAPSLDSALATLDQQVAALDTRGPVATAVERLRADAAALRFHLRDAGERPPTGGILRRTRPGQSTLLNRLLGQDLSAASFRRTFTAGAIAVTAKPQNLPPNWL